MRGRKRTGAAATRGKPKEPVLSPLPTSDTPKNGTLCADPATIPAENALSLSSSISTENINPETKTPRKRTSSRKQIQPTYIPRDDTKKVILGALEKCAAWGSINEDAKESVVRRVERACYNCVIDQCSDLYIEKSWDQVEFVNRYSAIVYKLISNIDLSRKYHAGSDKAEILPMASTEPVLNPVSLGDKIILGKIDITTAPLMSSYEMFPEATQKERDILEFRAGQKVQKKFTTRYGCPKCGQHKAEPKEVQTAANDEISRFNLLCLICNHTWFQK